jgi:hypothetical protein
VWFSSTNLQSAQQWHDEIGRALKRCNWFLLLLSKAAVKRRWVKHELTYALRERRYENHILPVLLEACDWEALSWVLGGLQFCDLRKDSLVGYRKILGNWGIALAETLCESLPSRRHAR